MQVDHTLDTLDTFSVCELFFVCGPQVFVSFSSTVSFGELGPLWADTLRATALLSVHRVRPPAAEELFPVESVSTVQMSGQTTDVAGVLRLPLCAPLCHGQDPSVLLLPPLPPIDSTPGRGPGGRGVEESS